MMRRGPALALPFLLLGCPAAPSDPPPPAAKLEIPAAPPRARGAKAGGTDGAPKPYLAPEGVGEPVVPVPPPTGAAPDAGAPAPENVAPPGAPDAGMAL